MTMVFTKYHKRKVASLMVGEEVKDAPDGKRIGMIHAAIYDEEKDSIVIDARLDDGSPIQGVYYL